MEILHVSSSYCLGDKGVKRQRQKREAGVGKIVMKPTRYSLNLCPNQLQLTSRAEIVLSFPLGGLFFSNLLNEYLTALR